MTIKCEDCGRVLKNKVRLAQHTRDKHEAPPESEHDPETEPDWGGECEVCGQSPIVPLTGMCGPCTWGEAETVGGNW